MGVELSPDGNDSSEFPAPIPITTNSVRLESAPVRFDAVVSPQESARQGDIIWISRMFLLAQMGKHLRRQYPVILALSDGITSHYVTLIGMRNGSDDYMLIYKDYWPEERGSFLEEGKNVADCKARPFKDREGAWVISAEELFRVYDSAIFVGPPEKKSVQDPATPSQPA